MQHDANRHMFSAVHAESNRTKQHQISTVEHLLRLLELTLLELWRETVLLWKVASMLDRLGSMGSIVSTVSKYRLCSHTINMNQYISCTLQAFACPICPVLMCKMMFITHVCRELWRPRQALRAAWTEYGDPQVTLWHCERSVSLQILFRNL